MAEWVAGAFRPGSALTPHVFSRRLLGAAEGGAPGKIQHHSRPQVLPVAVGAGGQQPPRAPRGAVPPAAHAGGQGGAARLPQLQQVIWGARATWGARAGLCALQGLGNLLIEDPRPGCAGGGSRYSSFCRDSEGYPGGIKVSEGSVVLMEINARAHPHSPVSDNGHLLISNCSPRTMTPPTGSTDAPHQLQVTRHDHETRPKDYRWERKTTTETDTQKTGISDTHFKVTVRNVCKRRDDKNEEFQRIGNGFQKGSNGNSAGNKNTATEIEKAKF